MSGPQTAQAKATLAASPSNVGESACRKARSRVPAVLLSAISAACEVSGRSAGRRLPAPSARVHGWPPACLHHDSTPSTMRGSPKGRLRAARLSVRTATNRTDPGRGNGWRAPIRGARHVRRVAHSSLAPGNSRTRSIRWRRISRGSSERSNAGNAWPRGRTWPRRSRTRSAER